LEFQIDTEGSGILFDQSPRGGELALRGLVDVSPDIS
jgi:hypothetical protein